MDQLDSRLLELLEEDASRTNKEMAERLGVSEGTVRNRVAAMRKDGTIRKFTIERGGRGAFRAIVLAETEASVPSSRIIAGARKLPEVKKSMELLGEWDLVLEVSCDSSERFNSVIDAVRAIPGVKRTMSLVIARVS